MERTPGQNEIAPGRGQEPERRRAGRWGCRPTRRDQPSHVAPVRHVALAPCEPLPRPGAVSCSCVVPVAEPSSGASPGSSIGSSVPARRVSSARAGIVAAGPARPSVPSVPSSCAIRSRFEGRSRLASARGAAAPPSGAAPPSARWRARAVPCRGRDALSRSWQGRCRRSGRRKRPGPCPPAARPGTLHGRPRPRQGRSPPRLASRCPTAVLDALRRRVRGGDGHRGRPVRGGGERVDPCGEEAAGRLPAGGQVQGRAA